MTESKNDPYKGKLGGFADKLKSTQLTTPLQEVVPVILPKPAQKENEEKGAQLNVWIPRDLFKKLKRHGLDAEMTLKEITIKALETYLSK